MNGILLGLILGLITFIGIIIIFNQDTKHKPHQEKQYIREKFEEVTGIKYIYDSKERKWLKENYFLKKQKN